MSDCMICDLYTVIDRRGDTSSDLVADLASVIPPRGHGLHNLAILQDYYRSPRIITSNHVITVETVWTIGKKQRRKIPCCTCGWIGTLAKTSTAADNQVRTQHPQVFCPTPDKIRHPNREHAELALLKFWQTAKLGKKELRRAYECECGVWHTTSQPARSNA